MRTAIVFDWLTTFGGAEHAFLPIVQHFPDAELFTTVASPLVLQRFGDHVLHTHPLLQAIYQRTGKYRFLLPLFPLAMETFDMSSFDLILSSSHAISTSIIPSAHARHICYCHTPMRYAWEMEEEYLFHARFPRFVERFVRSRLAKLRRIDMQAQKRVDFYIANSSETQRRIGSWYGRNSIKINPPVSSQFFASSLDALRTEALPEKYRELFSRLPAQFFFAVSRLVSYKRIDLLLELSATYQYPLVIAGTGPEEQALRAKAPSSVHFLGYVDDELLPFLYARSLALLFPAYEDAGIVPLEAQACGTPVVAYGCGGVLDTIRNGETGVFALQQTAEDFHIAIQKCLTIQFQPALLRKHAEQFTAQKFLERVPAVLPLTSIVVAFCTAYAV